MDPFFNDAFNISLQNTIVDGGFAIKNLKMLGMSKAQVKNVKSEFTDFGMDLELDLHFPKLFTTGFYKTNLFLAAIKLLSKGQFNVTMFNVNNKWTMKGKLINVAGKQFLDIYDTDIRMDIGDMDFSVSGVFENQALSKLEII